MNIGKNTTCSNDAIQKPRLKNSFFDRLLGFHHENGWFSLDIHHISPSQNPFATAQLQDFQVIGLTYLTYLTSGVQADCCGTIGSRPISCSPPGSRAARILGRFFLKVAPRWYPKCKSLTFWPVNGCWFPHFMVNFIGFDPSQKFWKTRTKTSCWGYEFRPQNISKWINMGRWCVVWMFFTNHSVIAWQIDSTQRHESICGFPLLLPSTLSGRVDVQEPLL